MVEDVEGPIDWKATAKAYEKALEKSYEYIKFLEEELRYCRIPYYEDDTE